jgi:hypothetical protein
MSSTMKILLLAVGAFIAYKLLSKPSTQGATLTSNPNAAPNNVGNANVGSQLVGMFTALFQAGAAYETAQANAPTQ